MTFRAGKRAAHRVGLRIPRQPRTLEDAIKLSGWAAVQVARGNISPAEANAIRATLAEFRCLLDVRDQDEKLAEAKRALAEMRAIRDGA